jgi:hypothetical protein
MPLSSDELLRIESAIRCTYCGQALVVAFFCNVRGVCPSYNSRHMAQTAALLADHVIPPVPVRQ